MFNTTLKEQLEEVTKATPLARKSLRERLWLWVKDNPGRSAKDIVKVFKGDPETSVSTTLRFLARCKVLEYQLEPQPRGGRAVAHYRVNPKMGGVYEYWPEPGKSKTGSTPKTEEKQPVQPPAPQTPQSEVMPPALLRMNMGEALAVYRYLHKLFGEKP